MLKAFITAVLAAILIVGLWAMYAPWTPAVLGFLAVVVLIGSLIVQLPLRLRWPPTALTAIVAVGLSGCAGFDPGKLAAAINEADKSPCYKDIDVRVTPMMMPWGMVIPVISGSFRKVCNPEKAPVAGAVQPGAVLGSP